MSERHHSALVPLGKIKHGRLGFPTLYLAVLSLGVGSAVHTSPAFAQLEEVIVTAQRRQESLRDVPISVVAISEEALVSAGITSTVNLPELVPSVKMDRSGPSGKLFIRGVGNTSGGTGEEGANALYVDGVYLYDMKQSVLKFNNIERIEVLKGPQGTLFGRNSSGGLINIITREPGDEVVVKANVGFGNYDTRTAQAYLASPLSDTLSADIALTSTDQGEGWGKNLATGKDVGKGWDWGARSKLVWRPSDTAKITLAGEYAKMSDDFAVFRTAPGGLGVAGTVPPSDPFDTNASDAQYTRQRNAGVSLTGEFDLDWATLTSISGYRDNETANSLDIDTGPLPLVRLDLRSVTTTFQQEFRLASNTVEPWSWQAGVFYMHAKARLKPQVTSGTAFGGLDNGLAVFSTMTTDSYAGFGEFGYAIGPDTRLIAGIRFTRDERRLDGEEVPVGGMPGVPISRRASVADEEITWRLAIHHDISDNVSAYASYNRGFKAGTFSMSSLFHDPVEPQVVDAYEVGLKSELFDRRLRLNGAAFYYDISDYQVRAATALGAPPVLLNAASVETYGLEIDFEAMPVDGLRIFGSGTYLKSEFSSFPFAPHTYPLPAVCTPNGPAPGMTTGAPIGGAVTCLGSAKGNDTPLAPRFAGTLGASYSMPLGPSGELRVSGLYSYSDSYAFEPDNRLKQPSHGIFNASIAYYPTLNWGVELWGRNLADKTHFVQMAGSELADIAVPAAPRTYGLTFMYTY